VFRARSHRHIHQVAVVQSRPQLSWLTVDPELSDLGTRHAQRLNGVDHTRRIVHRHNRNALAMTDRKQKPQRRGNSYGYGPALHASMISRLVRRAGVAFGVHCGLVGGTFGVDAFTDRGHDLLGESGELTGRFCPQNEGVESLQQSQIGNLVDPL